MSRCVKKPQWGPIIAIIKAFHDTHLQHGLHRDRRDHSGAYHLAVTHPLAHYEGHRCRESEGSEPHGADEFLGAAAGHDALGFERVADGHVALHAQAGDVKRGGIRATVPEEVVTPAHGVPEHPWVMEPDKVVELNGHGEDQNEQVGHGETGQVIVYGALKVLQRLSGNQGINSDGVAQGAYGEQSQVNDSDNDFCVHIRINFQFLLITCGTDGAVIKWRQ